VVVTDRPRLLFLGGTPRGLAVLEQLVAAGAPLVGVYAFEQDDHEHNRVEPQIHALAARAGVPCRTVKRIGAAEEREITEELRPDLALVIGWRTMIPMSVIDAAPLGWIGAHDSLLPRGRGFAPTNWAVILGHDAGGVTLMHLASGVDDGDIVGQRRIPIGERATAPELYDAVTEATVELVAEHLPGLLAGAAPRTPQQHDQATYFCARTPDDGEIDWTADTAQIDRLIRGLTFPYPGAWTTQSGERLIVWAAEPVSHLVRYEGSIPGRVAARHDDGSVDVLTGDGVLRVRTVGTDQDQIPAAERLRSVKETLGR
jgi:methionyl-tRNA formyltransferase